MIAAWKLPLIVSTIAISIVAGFYLGGPGLGMAVGGLAAASLVAMAIRNPPRPPIVPREAGDGRERLLLVLAGEAEEEAVARAASGLAREDGADEVLVLAPLRQRFLDRWACDTDGAQERAQDRLVFALATLAKAGIGASARVGDEDPVQAVEDVLGSYPATRVALLGDGAEGQDGAAAELGERLAVPFVRLDAPAGAALRESPAAECSGAAGRRRRRGARGRAAPASAAARRRNR